MKHIKILFVWIVVTFLLFISLFKNPYDFFINGTIVLGWLLFALQFTANQSESFYLFLRRNWLFVTNPECLWNMQVSMNGSYDRTIFSIIDDCLQRYGDSLRITKLSNTRQLYRIKSISIEISVDEDVGEIYFSIYDLEVSYRRSKDIIEKEISKLFELIQTKIKPDSRRFGLKIEFKGSNPYYGLYVKRMNVDDVQGFNITFKVENDRVAITKTCLEINTDSIQNLSILSKEYITLSPTS
jgi:hypothetical protein